jgi:signal recognition particle GTPase
LSKYILTGPSTARKVIRPELCLLHEEELQCRRSDKFAARRLLCGIEGSQAGSLETAKKLAALLQCKRSQLAPFDVRRDAAIRQRLEE